MESAVCDYSLEMYRSRPAEQDEEYVTYGFRSGTVGFIVPGNTSTAVCMSCDMRLTLTGISEHVRKIYRVGKTEEVVFTRRDEGPHRDAVRFKNGAVLTLQQLGINVRARVLDTLSGDGGTTLMRQALVSS